MVTSSGENANYKRIFGDVMQFTETIKACCLTGGKFEFSLQEKSCKYRGARLESASCSYIYDNEDDFHAPWYDYAVFLTINVCVLMTYVFSIKSISVYLCLWVC